MLKDIGKTALHNDEESEELEHYLKEISEHNAPSACTFGVAPSDKLRQSTAEAILNLAGKLSPAKACPAQGRAGRPDRAERPRHGSMRWSPAWPVATSLPGRATIRSAIRVLPTGRNLYGFDPARLPTPGTWEQGKPGR